MIHRLLCFAEYYWRAYRVASKISPQVVHAHDLNTLPVAWWLSRRQRSALVYDAHELYTESSWMAGVEQALWSRIEAGLIGRCDQVFTVCESIARELCLRYDVRRPVVLYNCPRAPQERKESTRIRSALGLPAARPVVLYQGGFSPKRGLFELVEAARWTGDVSIVMMGWGVLEAELRLRVATLGLEDRVLFLPPVDPEELLDWTASADVGVIPYQAAGLNNYYSCPNKLFEYVQAGIPIAASAFPELRRVVNGYDIGATFDPESPESIAKALRHLLARRRCDESLEANLAEAQRAFDWRREEVKLRIHYDELQSATSS